MVDAAALASTSMGAAVLAGCAVGAMSLSLPRMTENEIVGTTSGFGGEMIIGACASRAARVGVADDVGATAATGVRRVAGARVAAAGVETAAGVAAVAVRRPGVCCVARAGVFCGLKLGTNLPGVLCSPVRLQLKVLEVDAAAVEAPSEGTKLLDAKR